MIRLKAWLHAGATGALLISSASFIQLARSAGVAEIWVLAIGITVITGCMVVNGWRQVFG